MSSRPVAAVRETMVKSSAGKMWRKLKAGWKVGCFYAKRTAVRWFVRQADLYWITQRWWVEKQRNPDKRNDSVRLKLIWSWIKIWTRSRRGGLASAEKYLFFRYDGQAASDLWPCVCLSSPVRYLHLLRNSVRDRDSCLRFRTDQPPLNAYGKAWESSKTPLATQKLRRTEMSSLRRDYTTRLEKQAVGWLFSEQTNRTLGCLLKRSRTMGGRARGVSAAFLCLG